MTDKRTVRLQRLKQQIPNAMIGAGIALIIAFAIYEGVQYPWKLLFVQWGLIELEEELTEPSPLPEEALDPAAVVLPDEFDGELAMRDELLTPRPNMNLTKLGVIKIPKIQISENIVEGTGSEMLYAVGHLRGSAMPGKEGNCVLAAHRLYMRMRPFRYLDKIEAGDLIYIEDNENTYTYEAFKIFEITPEDTWVLQAQEEEENLLTLLTCTPVVNPTGRLIVWGRLSDIQPITKSA